ncbi:hypothetical protein D7X98_09440 [bacterium 1XD8-76]|nr:hypothetical protein D7X98_09440 [bacterium 1XD8-76]
MDGFIDKFAQRKNAQEMIRANAMAEAEEKERMALRISEYEMAIQEMRQCSLQNIENVEKVRELLEASLRKIEEVQKKEETFDEIKNILAGLKVQLAEFSKEQRDRLSEIVDKQRELIEEQNGRMQELMESQKTALEELVRGTEDFNHKEAVKVYRNVQAVIEAELPKQTEEIKNAMGEKSAPRSLTVIGVLTLVGVFANVAIEVLRILGYL